MGVKLLGLLLLWLVVAGATTDRDRSSRRRREQRGERKFEELKFERPREIYRSDGGRIEEWDPSRFPALADAEIGAKRLTLERNGLAVPCYKDSPMIKIVTRGSARVGIINPFTDKLIDRTSVFRVRKGDAIAVPRGVATWFYNDGDERTEILEVAETCSSPESGRFNVFLLAGGLQQREKTSVLRGFSKEMLAHAFDVEEQTVEHMLRGGEEAIIKVDERRKMSLPEESSSNTYFVNFVYRWSQAEPDVRVRNGGELRLLNKLKLPLLKTMNMGGACVKMEPGALTAPGWIHNAHKVVYIDQGSGQLQAVRENGETALDETVKEGDLIVIPANFPSAKLAGNEGLHYFSIFTSDHPIESYLAGRNSVYKGMPSQVVSTGLQIDQETQHKLEDARREEAYIFPPQKSPRHREESSVLTTLVGAM